MLKRRRDKRLTGGIRPHHFLLETCPSTTLSRVATLEEEIDSCAVNALDAYPVGSIYLNTSNVNPAILLGGGEWERIAQGRTLIGEGTSDRAFSGGSTGGESTHKLTTSEMPSHTHNHTPKGTVEAVVTDVNYNFYGSTGPGPVSFVNSISVVHNSPTFTGTQSATTATGGGQAHNNLPPYLVVYIWQRTA